MFQVRPYHILDDADVGKPISRDELFKRDDIDEIDEEAALMLTRGLDDRMEGSSEIEDDSDDGEEVSSDEDVPSDAELEPGSGYETGDSDDGGEELKESGGGVDDVGDEEELQMVQQRNALVEEQKRDSVKFQLNCWDKLVQLRLKLQPCLQEISKIPPPEKRMKYMSGEVSQSHRQKIITNVQGALDKLLDLQEQLIEKNSEVKALHSGKKPIDDDEIPSDTEEETDEEEAKHSPKKQKRKRKQTSEFYLSFAKENSEKLETFKSQTIAHWYEQTKVVAKKSSFMNKDVSVMEQIDHILSNKDRLITRTKQNRNGVHFIGDEDVEAESHPYIFNDDDFYQQLLREIIDKKMGKIDKNDPEAMGRQWAELQKLKIKTKKKSVDTKASKGRKIRYDVHSKLLGFMAPVSLDTLSDGRQDELFKSLFSSHL